VVSGVILSSYRRKSVGFRPPSSRATKRQRLNHRIASQSQQLVVSQSAMCVMQRLFQDRGHDAADGVVLLCKAGLGLMSVSYIMSRA
jgi:hypothetical protein